MDHIIPTIDGYDDEDFEDYDDERENQENDASGNRGGGRVDEEDSDEEDEDDENRFYYKTPSRQPNGLSQVPNGGVVVLNPSALPNGGAQFEGSLIRYLVPPQNTKTHNFDSVSAASFHSGMYY